MTEHRQILEYLRSADLSGVEGWQPSGDISLEPLARGEYNVNWLVGQADRRWVFRVNMGSQIGREDQALYEYRALKLLEPTGCTPRAWFVDDTRALLPRGVLLMEYLPGEPLDYGRDLSRAAGLFSRIHCRTAHEADNHLIREERPLSMTWEECSRLFADYACSDLADAGVVGYMREVLSWADGARRGECFFLADPWRCIVNTEVNSGNFIVNRPRGTIHLVDWEKPLWGDPSQDLSHFSVPTTTLWKSSHRLSREERQGFLDAYRAAVNDRHLADTIEERVRLRDPFNCLRGVTWSAMAWVAYQTGAHALRNEDTFRTMSSYLEPAFLRSLFDPVLEGAVP